MFRKNRKYLQYILGATVQIYLLFTGNEDSSSNPEENWAKKLNQRAKLFKTIQLY